MTVVLDASVALSAVVDSNHEGRWAVALVESESLACPEIMKVEVANGLRRMEIEGIISASKASQGLNALVRLDVEMYSFIPFAQRIWSLRHNVTRYDACYVALAEYLNCPLATLDLRLARAAGPRCQLLSPPQRLNS